MSVMNEQLYLVSMYASAALLAVVIGFYISKAQGSEKVRNSVASIVRFLVFISPVIIGIGLGMFIAFVASFACFKQECSEIESNAFEIFPSLLAVISVPLLFMSKKIALKAKNRLRDMRPAFWRIIGLTIAILGLLAGLIAVTVQIAI